MNGYSRNMQVLEVLMRRLTSLFSRRPEPISRPIVSPRDGITETVCAPKLHPRRCLNESGHKLYR
jgi:hypothetical protein